MDLKKMKIGESVVAGGAKSGFDAAAMSAAQEMSRGFPSEIEAYAKKGGMLFIHSYPDMDAALAGQNVIGRPDVLKATEWVIVVEAKQMKAKEGAYIFIGIPRLRGLGKGLIEKIVDGKAYISGMGSDLER